MLPPPAVPPLADYLDELRARGIRPGLEPLRAALARLGDPQSAFASIVVGGTNGKGSVVFYLDAILRAHGGRAASYLSPSLTRFTERAVLDGQESDGSDWETAHREAWSRLGGDPALTEFEYTTLLAFLIFARYRVEVAVLEIGMGGRYDAVNAVAPAVSVITSIGIDHREWLGDTLEQIALEKAGIIRSGKPVVIGELPAAALTVIAREAALRGAELVRPEPVAGLKLLNRAPVQHRDAGLALAAAARFLAERFDSASARAALAAVVIPGRGEELTNDGKRYYLDTAHNPEAAAALGAGLDVLPGEKHLLVGLVRDKDAAGFFDAVGDRFASITTVTLAGPRGRAAAELAAVAVARGAASVTAGAVADPAGVFATWDAALPAAALRVIAGSHHLVGPVRELLTGGTV